MLLLLLLLLLKLQVIVGKYLIESTLYVLTVFPWMGDVLNCVQIHGNLGDFHLDEIFSKILDII